MLRSILVLSAILVVIAGLYLFPWTTETTEAGYSPLFAQSLGGTVAGLSAPRPPSLSIAGSTDGGGEPELVTCEITCFNTCTQPTCGTTCINTCAATCANTCAHITCGTTCISVTCELTCMATCQTTCANTCSQVTCASTCVVSCSYTCCTTPITLISFNAQGAPDRVILAWSTASEIDNYMFLIRRADDPDGEFKLIATVPSQFTNGNTNYALSDFDVVPGVTYYYTLADVSLSGVEVIHPIVASAAAGPAGDFILAQNYPNPFNAGTTIRFTLPYPAKVRLEVFDAQGAHVKVLVDEPQSAGRHEALWDGKSYDGRLAVSGIYIYRLQAGDMISTGKMVLVK